MKYPFDRDKIKIRFIGKNNKVAEATLPKPIYNM